LHGISGARDRDAILHVPHNVDAVLFLAREIWPRIRAQRPGAELEIVGADALPQVLALAGMPGVRVTGAVPSLLPVWERSGLLIAPLRYSAGIQNKVLEPMAAGVPVVTTPQAAEAIGARDGVELRTGADAASLAAAALELLGAGERLMPMLGAARELVRRRFSWQTLVDRLERLAGGGNPG
jgi:glycosyltransferase involved in cell wall biosynthesis